eukprot:jgi/Astpho2/2359/gw1.00044.92.1_t
MNSVLQCLTHTPPLAEALLAKDIKGHRNGINGRAWDALSMTQQHDAHEYLVALLDAMHEAQVAGVQPRPPTDVAQTSLIYSIFAGRIRSQVKCVQCGHESNTHQAFLDLSLDIRREKSVRNALQRFVGVEYLDGTNKYKCPKHNQKVRAAKQMAIEQAPNVLVLQLKRFEFSAFGHKISEMVQYPLELDLAPFMVKRHGPSIMYDLYGVLVHLGHSVHSGHYYCYIKGPNGLWYKMDDTVVSQVAERQALAQRAYILFYIR